MLGASSIKCMIVTAVLLLVHRQWHAFGGMTGTRARALVLVSLLYSTRLLHGTNPENEQYLLERLAVPTRVMNRAFTQMAAITLPIDTSSVAAHPNDCGDHS